MERANSVSRGWKTLVELVCLLRVIASSIGWNEASEKEKEKKKEPKGEKRKETVDINE